MVKRLVQQLLKNENFLCFLLMSHEEKTHHIGVSPTFPDLDGFHSIFVSLVYKGS